MSLNNDYISQFLTHQRIDDLLAEAANERLVRLARGARPHSPGRGFHWPALRRPHPAS